MNYRRLFIQNGLVFLTIVTNGKIPILVSNIKLVKNAFGNIKKYYNFDLIAYSVQPDHIHCIIKPLNIKEYPKIIKSFKYSFTKNFNVGLVNPTYKYIWQNRYWEHTIRDDNDLCKHIDYIHYNPVKHNLVSAVKNWEYSSFHDFVKDGYYEEDWCNFGDKYDILNMELE